MSRGNEEVEGPYGHMAWRPVVVSMMLAPRQVLLPRPCGPLLPRRYRGKLHHMQRAGRTAVLPAESSAFPWVIVVSWAHFV